MVWLYSNFYKKNNKYFYKLLYFYKVLYFCDAKDCDAKDKRFTFIKYYTFVKQKIQLFFLLL